jgi:hypothetical protein
MTAVTPGRSSRLLTRGRLAAHAAIVAGLAVALGGCPPTPAPPNPNLLCFPGISGVPGFGGAPAIDGHLSGTPQVSPPAEFGWTGSMRYTFGNGTQVPDAAVQGISDGSNLYLSFEVNFASTPDIKDGILMVFRPTANTPTNDRRIFIAPFQNNVVPPANTPFSPQSVQYWVDSTNDAWNDPNQAAGQPAVNPAFLANNIKVQRDASNTWYLEMKIPLGGGATNGIASKANDTTINLPGSGDFGFYFDILDHPGGYIEHTFPENTGLTASQGIAAPSTNTPAAAAWGRGSLGGIQCNGVSFDAYRDVWIKHPDTVNPISPADMSLNQRNQFTVTVWNDSVDAGGNRIPALDVDAHFKIANFGIATPSDYANINPSGPSHNCAAGGTEIAARTCLDVTVPVPPNASVQGSAVIQSEDWTLSPGEQGQYQNHLHQCILVELNSNAKTPPTILRTKSAVRNSDFVVTSSPYRRSVTISAGRERREDSEMLLFTRGANTPVDAKWSVALQGAQPVAGTTNAFTLKVPAGKAVEVDTTTDPPPIALPSQDVRVPPNAGADGRGVSIPVKPGDLITLLASGSIQVRRDKQLRAGPDGALLDSRGDTQPYALLPSGFSPATRVGGLIGAWNGDFRRNAVIIGSANTLKAPVNAESLVLALNDTQAGFAEHSGEGFQVQVVQTPLAPYYATADTSVLREPSAERLRVSVGANLPTMVTCGYRKTGRKVTVNGFTDDLLEKVGCYGYQFKRIGITTNPR